MSWWLLLDKNRHALRFSRYLKWTWDSCHPRKKMMNTWCVLTYGLLSFGVSFVFHSRRIEALLEDQSPDFNQSLIHGHQCHHPQVRIAWLYLLFIAGSQIFVILAITVPLAFQPGLKPCLVWLNWLQSVPLKNPFGVSVLVCQYVIPPVFSEYLYIYIYIYRFHFFWGASTRNLTHVSPEPSAVMCFHQKSLGNVAGCQVLYPPSVPWTVWLDLGLRVLFWIE